MDKKQQKYKQNINSEIPLKYYEKIHYEESQKYQTQKTDNEKKYGN